MSKILRSAMPKPIRSAVTTAQIVSTMKRGENGISRVSMAPSSNGPRFDFGALLFSSATIPILSPA
ncbi:hypothetical protein AB7M42_000604 [Bradyrhizobium diazoefficiens]|uniref:hypothetical protein n=1 Tax=Bradyrhizobium diazoefficiens TaxID=1355477 RepID=UPI003471AA6E